MVLINQFSTVKPEESDATTENDTKNHEMISNIVTALIYGGLDARFVIEEMEIADLPLFIKGLETKKREELENCRLWTFFNILPHVGKEIKKPQDIMCFPWEEILNKKEAEKNTKDSKDMFNAFMNGKIN